VDSAIGCKCCPFSAEDSAVALPFGGWRAVGANEHKYSQQEPQKSLSSQLRSNCISAVVQNFHGCHSGARGRRRDGVHHASNGCVGGYVKKCALRAVVTEGGEKLADARI